MLRMKATLDIDDQLLSEAKALAAHQRTSLTRLIEEGLPCEVLAGFLRLVTSARVFRRPTPTELPFF